MVEMLFSEGSYSAIILLLMLTSIGFPLPEEVPVIYAGVMASQGKLDMMMAYACCLGGVLVSDCVLYVIGRHFGRRIVCEHRYWARFMNPEREARIERMIANHGLKVLFVARFLVGIRATIFVTAGILKVPFRRFLVVDTTSVLLVVGSFFLMSYHFGGAFFSWIQRAEVLLTWLVLAVGLGVGIYLWKRQRQNPSCHDMSKH